MIDLQGFQRLTGREMKFKIYKGVECEGMCECPACHYMFYPYSHENLYCPKCDFEEDKINTDP